MHHGYDIRVPGAIRRVLTALSLGLALCLSAESRAISSEGLVAMASVQGVLIAIANVNRAMRDAAENPMDKWRREAVQSAIRAMPPAIIALAADFKAGQLHDKDFPMVQAMLGGFVDVNAADNYKKFLNKPSADLIPQVGSNFPQQFLGGASGPSGPSAGHQTVTFDDNASKGSAPAPVAMVNSTSEVKAAAMKGIGEKQDKAMDSLRVTFEDEAKKADGSSVPKGETKFGFSAAPVDDSTMSRLERAMAASVSNPARHSASSAQAGSASSALTGSGTLIRRAPAAVENSLDADFFGKPEDLKKGKPRADFHLKVKPKYWQMSPYIQLIESLMIKEAHAEGGCKDCQGGGKGGGGGQQAAQILMGIAAIMASIAPMIVAGIQADAEKEIAATQAKAQIEMTNISANTSKFISNQNTEVTLQQTAAAERINRLNQDGVSQRLDMQLAELRNAREDAGQREKDRLAEEQRLNGQRIALAQKQADDNLKLARQSLNAQLTQAGLTSGFGNSRNSGNGLTSTTLAGNVGTTATKGTTSSASTATASTSRVGVKESRISSASSSSSSSSGLGVSLGDSASVASSGSSSGGGAGITIADRIHGGSSSNRAALPAADGRSRLLTSASGGVPSAPGASASSSVSSGSALAAANVVHGPASSTAATRAITPGKPLVASSNDARALSALLNGSAHRAVRGSSNGQRVAITSSDANMLLPGSTNSDLTSFTEQAQTADSTSFAATRRPKVYQDSSPGPEDLVVRTVASPSGVHNPPIAGASGHGGSRAITD